MDKKENSRPWLDESNMSQEEFFNTICWDPFCKCPVKCEPSHPDNKNHKCTGLTKDYKEKNK